MDQSTELSLSKQQKATGHKPLRTAVILPWTGEDEGQRALEAKLEEGAQLATAINLDVVCSEIIHVRKLKPSTLFGSGQLEVVGTLLENNEVEILIVDAPLTPVQQRNLERAFEVKVLDRTGLILEIFGARAATREGMLQVELAHLEYQRSRLVRLWTHLERQRGGVGFMGGPGETQIEADRRVIDEKLVRLKKSLEKVRRTRTLHRKVRDKIPFPVIALVGYTNAGKSTLFNNLTKAGTKAQDQLFATLDPLMRKIRLPSGRHVILSDTVGFISGLPTELVEAFRATLEEVSEADVILHVRDFSHPDTDAQREDVINVLDGMAEDGMIDHSWRERVIEVRNKADLMDHVTPGSGNVSALTGEGIPWLLGQIDEKLNKGLLNYRFKFGCEKGAELAWLFEHGEVLEKSVDKEGLNLDVLVKMNEKELKRFETLYPEISWEIVD